MSPVSFPTKPAPLSPALLLGACTLIGWMAFAIWPRLLLLLGISDYGQWYLDSYAVLAAVDAVRAGIDPSGASNPLDPLLRNHKYSDWWFALRWLGVTREYNFLVGSAWIAAFGAAIWQTARPRNFREAGFMGLLLLSPPVLLAVVRANNDLVIFVLLAVCGMAAAGATWGRQLLAVGALVLATGLKFYPAPAALAFLFVRPVRRMPVVLLSAGLAAGVTLASIWPQIARGQFPVESDVHTFGGPLLCRVWGWPDQASLWIGLPVLTLIAIGLALGRFTTGLATQGDLRDRLLAAMGNIVLLACFTAGVSYAYRWIFSLWMAPWLWRQSATLVGPARARWTAGLGCGLLLACCWLDGAFCLVGNVLLTPLSQQRIAVLQSNWRLWTQPLSWVLMMLLAGWLLEATVVTAREWQTSRAKV